MPNSRKRPTKGQRSVEVPFTVLPCQKGFQVFRVDVPGSLHEVTGTPDNPDCNCPEFVWRPNLENRCSHTQAVFRYLHERPDMRAVWRDRVQAPCNRPPYCVGESNESIVPTTVQLVRQVSRDGKFDTLSVHFSLDTHGWTTQGIGHAIKKLAAQQAELIDHFTNAAEQPISAILRNLGGVQTAKGRRFFLNCEVDGSVHKLFGTMCELDEHLAGVGIEYPEPNLAEGMIFNMPCRVVLTPSECGRYLNVKKLLGTVESTSA